MTEMDRSVIGEQLEHLDIFDPTLADAFYPVTHEARQRCPIGHTDRNGGHWYVTSYELAREVLADAEGFSSAYAGIPGRPESAGKVRSVVSTDPPLHREYRSILDPPFSRRAIEVHEHEVRAIARSLIDEFVDDGRVEAMAQYAQPMTAMVLASVLCGVDWEEHREELLRLARLKEHVLATAVPDPEASRNEQRAMALRFVRERQASGVKRGDVLDALLEGTVEGRPLSEDEVVANLALVIGAGLDTTKTAISNLFWRMTLDPTLEGRLRDTDWVSGGLDELLRIDAPVTGLSRTVMRPDTVLAGCPVPEGALVHVMFAAANRDAAVFTNPDSIDFERVRNPHLAFGGVGVHRCVGSNLARLQIQVAIDELLARVSNIRLEAGAVVRWSPGTIRHVLALPLVFDPA